MADQFTPGPWRVGFTRFSEVTAENGALIAKCNKLTNLVGLQANAQLISAAPELLDLLTELVAVVRGECPSLLNEDSGGNAELSIQIDAVIAKARGRRHV